MLTKKAFLQTSYKSMDTNNCFVFHCSSGSNNKQLLEIMAPMTYVSISQTPLTFKKSFWLTYKNVNTKYFLNKLLYTVVVFIFYLFLRIIIRTFMYLNKHDII